MSLERGLVGASDDHSIIYALQGRLDRIAGLSVPPSNDSIIECWQRWGTDLFRRLEGDWSLALWDGRRRRLILARAPLSNHYLCVRLLDGRASFGTSPAALAGRATISLDGVARHFHHDRLAGPATSCWTGVEAVRPGTFVEVGEGANRSARFWRPGSQACEDRPDDQRAEELRDLMASNVRRSVEGPAATASQLSGGRDSSVVTALAGEYLEARGDTLRAYTAVPGGEAMSIPGYPSDESATAASLARRYRAIEHVIVRSTTVGLCAALDRAHAVHHEPLIDPVSMAWWGGLMDAAAAAGNRRILTGELGNLGLSAGGAVALGELVARGDVAGWLRIARAWSGSWRTLVHQSIGSFVPVRPYGWVMRRSGNIAPPAELAFLRGELLNRRREAVAEQGDVRPPRRYREALAQIAMGLDPAERMSRDLHGIERIDPTCDPRLIEFALSLSPRQLAAPPNARPIFDRAFADRLPEAVLRPPGRGLQSADYHRVIDQAELRAGVDRYASNPLVREYLDMDAISAAIERWPRDAGDAARDYGVIAGGLLPAVSLASFLSVHSGE